MQLSELNDVDLVKRFHRGDEAAFVEFVTRHQDRVYRLAHMWLFDVSFADDVLQEVMLRTYQGLARFRFRSAPTTWLVRVAKNVCLEMNRKARLAQYQSVGETSVDELTDDIERRQFTEEPFTQEEGQYVRRQIMCLTQRQREVVSLRILEELSVKDTAQIMQCREGTVKALLYKALANLKMEMANDH